MNVKTGFLLFIFSGFSLLISAQQQEGWEAGGWLGIANYFGDLNTNFRFNGAGAAGGVAARYNFNERVALKFGLNYGKVQADDANSDNVFERARNLSFKSNLLDIGAQFEFNFLPYNHGSKDEGWTPYLFGGFGVTRFDPKAKIDGQWHSLREFGTEGQFKGDEYSKVSTSFIYGFGFKIDLSYEWSLNFEFSARQLFSDYLDDVSTVYANVRDIKNLRGDLAARLSDRSPELFQEDPNFFVQNNLEFPIGQPGRQRGNSKNNDSYVLFGIGLMYYFGDLKCPYGH